MNKITFKKSLLTVLSLIILLQPSFLVKASEIDDFDEFDETSTVIEQIAIDNKYSNYSYEAGFKLGIQLKNNTTIKSFMKFKIDVNENGNIKFGLDGSASERGYVWSDKFNIKIIDSNGNEKYSTTLMDWNSAYPASLALIDELNRANVLVDDTISIKTTYWKDTVGFYSIGNKPLYKPSANKNLNYHDAYTNAYAISQHGLILQTKNNTVKVNPNYNLELKLNVKNNQTGKTEERIVTMVASTKKDLDTGRERYLFSIKKDKFGIEEGYSWADNYIIFSEENDNIAEGVYLRKGTSVSEGLDSLIDAYHFHSSTKRNTYKISLRSDNNTIKLVDSNSVQPALFTNTNDNFSDGFSSNIITFYETEFGLIQE